MAVPGNSNAGKVALAGGAVALITAAILASRKSVSAQGGGTVPTTVVTLDDNTMDLLIAIANATGQSVTDLQNILTALSNSPSNQGYPQNADTIDNGQVSLSLVGVSLPSLVIPDNFAIVIKAFVGNPIGSYVLVSGSKAGSSGLSTSYPLSPGETIAYKVKNASSIYVAATIIPAFINFTVEQRSS